MKKSPLALDCTIADEVWIAAALLHREHPEREDFSVQEILDRAKAENITGQLRPGLYTHVNAHCVANRPPSPARLRMLYATGKKRRRLYRDGDAANPGRGKKMTPEPDSMPEPYRYLLTWYRAEYSPPSHRGWLQGVFDLAGTGKQIYKGVDPDEYVRSLREGWELSRLVSTRRLNQSVHHQ